MENENKDGWYWLENLWSRLKNISITNRTRGILLVVIPCVILLGVGIYWYLTATIFTKAMASIVTVNITNPPAHFFDSTAQIVAGVGICMASICWGVSKIIKSLK